MGGGIKKRGEGNEQEKQKYRIDELKTQFENSGKDLLQPTVSFPSRIDVSVTSMYKIYQSYKSPRIFHQFDYIFAVHEMSLKSNGKLIIDLFLLANYHNGYAICDLALSNS